MQSGKHVCCVENMVKRCCIILPDDESGGYSQDILEEIVAPQGEFTTNGVSSECKQLKDLKIAEVEKNTNDEQKIKLAAEGHCRILPNTIPSKYSNKQWIIIGFSIVSLYLLGATCITSAIFATEQTPVLILTISGCVFIGQASSALCFIKTIKATLELMYKCSSRKRHYVSAN